MDHPDSAVINLANAAHLVTEVWWDGDAVMGKVQILNTPSGQILRSLVESGVKLGISSRGMGSVHEQGGQTIVEEDFQLICFDFVSEPSTTGAFMMQESKQPNIITKADRINRALNDILRENEKSELRQVLKPLIKECIKEVIFEEGILSNIVSEVAQGLGAQTIVEAKKPAPPQRDYEAENRVAKQNCKKRENEC